MLSKRKLNALVAEGKIEGWDAAVMPTVSGLRRRGYTAEMLREFVLRCGFGRANSTVSLGVLDDAVCDILGPVAERRMAVLDPVELVIENLDGPLDVTLPKHPKDASRGSRKLSLTKSVWVERSDVRPEAAEGFWRLAPGNWVRLKNALNVLVKSVEADDAGQPIRVIAEADLASVDMKAAKVKARAVLHWLSDGDSMPADVWRYGPLFDVSGVFDDGAAAAWKARVERGLSAETHFEFERNGHVWCDRDAKLHFLAALKSSRSKA